jgi:hypothetical protein
MAFSSLQAMDQYAFAPSDIADEMQDGPDPNLSCEYIFEELGALYSEIASGHRVSNQNRFNGLISRSIR